MRLQKVAANIKAIYSARKNQMAIDAEAKVRRALRSKTRDVYSEIVETGENFEFFAFFFIQNM